MTHPHELGIAGPVALKDQTAGLGLFALNPTGFSGVIQSPGVVSRPAPEPAEPAEPDRAKGLPPTKEEREAARERIKVEVLAPLLEVARGRIGSLDRPGVTADDVRALAEMTHQGVLLGQAQRAWSWCGPWLAQLAREGWLAAYEILPGQCYQRRSTRDESHGNAQNVYLHPDDPRAPAEAP